MANHQLTYSRRALLGYAALALPMGVTALLIALGVDDLMSRRKLGILGLLGPTGLRVLLVVGGIFFVAIGICMLRRLLGDRTAAVIRHDGVALNGPLLTQFVRWRGLDRVSVKGRRINGKLVGFINLETNELDDTNMLRRLFLKGLSWGLATNLLNQNLDEAMDWAERANSARREALSNRPPASTVVADEPIHRPRAQFGRRTSTLR